LTDGSPLETRQCATPQLLGALCRDVDKKEPARDGSRALGVGRVIDLIWSVVLNHDLPDYMKRLQSATQSTQRKGARAGAAPALM
jgi:hypothetical protein